MAELDEERIDRYSRQLLIPGWGSREQERLGGIHLAVSANAPVFALYLAGAGVGRLSLLFDGRDGLARRIRALNPLVAVDEWTAGGSLPELTVVCAAEAALVPAPLRAVPVESIGPDYSAQALAAALVIKRLVIAPAVI